MKGWSVGEPRGKERKRDRYTERETNTDTDKSAHSGKERTNDLKKFF